MYDSNIISLDKLSRANHAWLPGRGLTCVWPALGLTRVCVASGRGRRYYSLGATAAESFFRPYLWTITTLGITSAPEVMKHHTENSLMIPFLVFEE